MRPAIITFVVLMLCSAAFAPVASKESGHSMFYGWHPIWALPFDCAKLGYTTIYCSLDYAAMLIQVVVCVLIAFAVFLWNKPKT